MQAVLLNRCDARTKLLMTAIGAVATISFSGLSAQLTLFAASLAYAATIRRPVLLTVLYCAMTLMMIISALCAMAIYSVLPVGELDVRKLVIPFLRGCTMMNLVVGLAMSTRIEHVMTALSQLRLPFYLSLPCTVMIRFIPTFTSDVSQVWETLKIRGWNMGAKMLFMHPILSTRLVFTPILFRALKSSEILGVAAELKGVDRSLRESRRMTNDAPGLGKSDIVMLSACTFTLLLAVALERYAPLAVGKAMY